MKSFFDFFINNWHLLLVAFTSGAFLVWPAVSRGMRAGSLTPSAAVQLINRERAIVVDVSNPQEYQAGHVVGAKNVPLDDFEKRLPEVVKNKALPLILLCPSGARANRALASAKKLGYERAQVLSGGLAAWREANLPLAKA